MAHAKDLSMIVTAANAASATLVPAAYNGSQAPTQIVITYDVLPVEFKTGKSVRIRLEVD